MQKNDFEIFHFRGQIPEENEVHHHEFYELYFLLEGKVTYLIDGQTYCLESGDIMLINPMVLHRPILETKCSVNERIVLWLNKNFLEGISNKSDSLSSCFDVANSAHTNLIRPNAIIRNEMIECLNEIIQESYSDDYGSKAYANGMLLKFLVMLNRFAINYGFKGEEKSESTKLISKVLEFIGEHFKEDLSLEAIAQNFFISKYYLSHEFSKNLGISVHKYIMLCRLISAKRSLMDGVSLNEVYHQCGFKDYSNFYRAFKAEYGMNPREFCSSKISK